MSGKIFAIIIAYNQNLELNIINNIIDCNFEVVVVDNSTDQKIKDLNQNSCRQNNLIYIDSQKNVGLSRGYNLAISWILENENDLSNAWIMTLDQDTLVDKQYFINVQKSINIAESYPIKSGLIEFNNYIGSPMRISNFRKIYKNGNLWLNAECINSCLVIRLDTLKQVGFYDECLFLDQVDRLILFKLRKLGYKSIEIIDGKIKQNFSGDKFTNKLNDISRFRIYAKDTLRYVIISGDRIVSMLISILRRWLHIKIRYWRNDE